MTVPLSDLPFSVTPASPEDAAGIAHVRKETWLATYPHPDSGVTVEDILSKQLDSDDQVQRWRKAIEQTDGPRRLWVAKTAAGTIVGYGQGKQREERNEIWGLYVLPAYQGNGLGRQLLAEVIAWLGDEKPIDLSVATYSERAIAVYQSFGFAVIGSDPSSPTFASGAVIPSLSMRRPAQSI